MKRSLIWTILILLTSLSYADNGHQTSLITLTAPAEGTAATVGSSITVTVQPLENVSLKMVEFMAAGDNPDYNQNIAWDSVANPPYTDIIKIPATNFIGNVVITVMAVDAQGNYDTQKRTVRVLTGSDLGLKSISVDDESGSLGWAKFLNFTDLKNPQGLVVKGTFSDGVARDITVADNTVYTTSDPSVAVVDKSGHVSAVGNGSAQITVTNSGESAQVSVKVNLQQPAVMSLFPQSIQSGAGKTNLVVVGSNLGGTSKVEFYRDGEPDTHHLTVGQLSLGPNACNIQVPLSVVSETPTGTYVVVITTPVGTSSKIPAQGNVLTIK